MKQQSNILCGNMADTALTAVTMAPTPSPHGCVIRRAPASLDCCSHLSWRRLRLWGAALGSRLLSTWLRGPESNTHSQVIQTPAWWGKSSVEVKGTEHPLSLGSLCWFSRPSSFTCHPPAKKVLPSSAVGMPWLPCSPLIRTWGGAEVRVSLLTTNSHTT